ncbi:hypothetical protein U9M48_027058 [Paspalum notatum var. saurae]|uniref:Uncharacterized protein n=1 Tax=Paspalum notatum var. saurae TaxID=547442 RepID=A0AAQ3TTM4_PASNO
MPHRWNRSVPVFFGEKETPYILPSVRPSAVSFCAGAHARGEVPRTPSLRPSTSPTGASLVPLSSLFYPPLLSQEPRKKKVLPKLLSQDSTLEAIGDHGAPLLLLLGQEGARGPISLPFDFHNLGAALSSFSTLGEPKTVYGYFYPAEGGDGQE